MTTTYQATGSEIFELAKRIEDEGGHANAYAYLKNPWGGYSSTMEITATFPDQPELIPHENARIHETAFNKRLEQPTQRNHEPPIQ